MSVIIISKEFNMPEKESKIAIISTEISFFEDAESEILTNFVNTKKGGIFHSTII